LLAARADDRRRIAARSQAHGSRGGDSGVSDTDIDAADRTPVARGVQVDVQPLFANFEDLARSTESGRGGNAAQRDFALASDANDLADAFLAVSGFAFPIEGAEASGGPAAIRGTEFLVHGRFGYEGGQDAAHGRDADVVMAATAFALFVDAARTTDAEQASTGAVLAVFRAANHVGGEDRHAESVVALSGFTLGVIFTLTTNPATRRIVTRVVEEVGNRAKEAAATGEGDDLIVLPGGVARRRNRHTARPREFRQAEVPPIDSEQPSRCIA
jgi:hypothetical protein